MPQNKKSGNVLGLRFEFCKVSILNSKRLVAFFANNIKSFMKDSFLYLDLFLPKSKHNYLM